MASIGTVTVNVTVIIDRPAVERAREELRASLDELALDPVIVHDIVDRIMERAPLVRYIQT